MRHLLSLLPVLCVLSCASDNESAAPTRSAPKTMSERFNGGSIKQDASGQWPAEMKQEYTLTGDQKSPAFASQSALPKPYQAGEYAKTTWWGKSAYQTQPYSGKKAATQYQKAARDQGVAAPQAGAVAAVSGPYQTGTYQTNSAHEAAAKPVATPNSVDSGRAYPEQDVMGWKQMRALDVNATKSILGRE